MEYLLLFTAPQGAPEPEPAGIAEMTKYAEELADRKILRRGAPLAFDAEGACVRVRDGRTIVSDGPFAESKEAIGGFWVVEAEDRDAAIALARRAPHVRSATAEVHRIGFRGDFGDSGRGKPFLLLFRMEPGFSDPDGTKGREMRAFGEPLVHAGTMFETAHLPGDERAARVQTRAGKALVTDGPFAESKELVGGYALVRVAGRAEAIDLAQRFPHARWGPVEVREVLFFDRV